MQVASEVTVESLLSDRQVWKFKFYGFLKNLQLFESFLLACLLDRGHSLSEIGWLMSLQQISVYSLELPSGVIADRMGAKHALLLSFACYISSFALFFLDWSLMSAFILFGAGEAFRSGSHKSLILQWLDSKASVCHKTRVYGECRAFAQIGSAIASLIAASLMYGMNSEQSTHYHWLFALSIIPFVLNFILILSYPDFNIGGITTLIKKDDSSLTTKSTNNKTTTMMNQFSLLFCCSMMGLSESKQILCDVSNRRLSLLLLDSAVFDAMFKTLKDFIQAVVFLQFTKQTDNENKNQSWNKDVILGLSYSVFYLVSASASRRSHIIEQWCKGRLDSAMHGLFLMLSLIFLFTSVSIWLNDPCSLVCCFIALYICFNLRRPLTVSALSTRMNPSQRATVLSIESLLKSVMICVFSPVFALCADHTSLCVCFFLAFSLALVFSLFFKRIHRS